MGQQRARIRRLVAAVAVAALGLGVAASPAAAIDAKQPPKQTHRRSGDKADSTHRYTQALKKMTRKQKRALLKGYTHSISGSNQGKYQPPCPSCMSASRVRLHDGVNRQPDGTTIIVSHGGGARPVGSSAPKNVYRPNIAINGWVSISYYGYNITHAKAWRYTQRNDWSWSANNNGQQVVVADSGPQISDHVYGWAAADGWQAGGKQDDKSWDYYGDHWVTRNYSEGTMNFCPPRIWCFQSVYPWIYIDNYGNGTYDAYYGK